MTINGFKNIIGALTKGAKCDIETTMYDNFDFVTYELNDCHNHCPSCYVLMIGRINGLPTLIRMTMYGETVKEDSIVKEIFNPFKGWFEAWDEFIEESGVMTTQAKLVSRRRFDEYRKRYINEK